MTVAERVAELLTGVPVEDVLRGREVAEAGKLLGISTATTYRYIGEGKLGHVKLEGSARKGHGRAGAVRVRLIDLVKFQVENEVTSGAVTRKQRPALATPARGETHENSDAHDDSASTACASTGEGRP
jgi:excisionase family DNA binding protein